MRVLILAVASCLYCFNFLQAQRSCTTNEYLQSNSQSHPSSITKSADIEKFIYNQLNKQVALSGEGSAIPTVIRIPVVVHVLYHLPAENISDLQIKSQIQVLNECYRRLQADTSKTPAYFKAVAADCQIEFQLATSDPNKRATSGIIHKYTPIEKWKADDMVKYSAQMGDDAWDASSYLNIWICNMRGVAGFSSAPGNDAAKDGIVLDYNVVGVNQKSGYELGKTAVHEVGHWLGLKHIWGDASCGDDEVSDTPKQSTYSVGCPAGIRTACDNSANGIMYMNYMDFTNDACTNLFTLGQRSRMRALFASGGPRAGLLVSKGLSAPLYSEAPLAESYPTWMHPQLYPNPTSGEVTIDVSYDARWVGKTLQVINMQGAVVVQSIIASKIHKMSISKLPPGIYFIAGKTESGESIRQKIVKL